VGKKKKKREKGRGKEEKEREKRGKQILGGFKVSLPISLRGREKEEKKMEEREREAREAFPGKRLFKSQPTFAAQASSPV